MKKYLLIGLLLLTPFFAKAEVPENTFFFGDGKGYNVDGNQMYYCFQDGSCYSLEGTFAFIREVQGKLTNLEARVLDLESKSDNMLVGASPAVLVDTSNATRVKSEINSYLQGLKNQIDSINNSFIPVYGVFWKEKPTSYEQPYQIMQLESNFPGTERIPLKDISSYQQLNNIQGLEKQAAKFITESQAKIQELQTQVNRLNTISFEVNDYVSTGNLSADSRNYLQSLGINW